MILNKNEKIGLKHIQKVSGPIPIKVNYYNDKNNNRNNLLANESIINEEKKLRMNSLPPNRNTEDLKSKLTSKFNVSEPSLFNSNNAYNNKNDTLINSTTRSNNNSIIKKDPLKERLINDINKKINLNMKYENDSSNSQINTSVHKMINNSDNNLEIEKPKINNINNNNKEKQIEIYTQFENSLNISLDLVNILIQIFDISSDSIENFYTEYKEVILTKSSDLINESSNLFKQISDETQDEEETVIIMTKNQKMIELGNELASIIRKIVSSLKMYLKIVKKDQLIQVSELALKSRINTEIEACKKVTICELKQYIDELKNNLLVFKEEMKKIDI